MQFLNCRKGALWLWALTISVTSGHKAMSMRQNRIRISNRNQSSFTRKFDIELNRTTIELNPTQSNIDRQSKFSTFSLFDCVRQTDINRLTEFNCFRLHFGNREFDWDRLVVTITTLCIPVHVRLLSLTIKFSTHTISRPTGIFQPNSTEEEGRLHSRSQYRYRCVSSTSIGDNQKNYYSKNWNHNDLHLMVVYK